MGCCVMTQCHPGVSPPSLEVGPRQRVRSIPYESILHTVGITPSKSRSDEDPASLTACGVSAFRPSQPSGLGRRVHVPRLRRHFLLGRSSRGVGRHPDDAGAAGADPGLLRPAHPAARSPGDRRLRSAAASHDCSGDAGCATDGGDSRFNSRAASCALQTLPCRSRPWRSAPAESRGLSAGKPRHGRKRFRRPASAPAGRSAE